MGLRSLLPRARHAQFSFPHCDDEQMSSEKLSLCLETLGSPLPTGHVPFLLVYEEQGLLTGGKYTM